MTIRAMEADDLPSVEPLMHQLGYEIGADELHRRFETVTGAADHLVLVAEEEGEIVGFAHAFVRNALEKPPEVVTQSLVVDQAKRHRGIGQTLMAAVENWAIEMGSVSVSLSTQIERDGAHAFYARLGYVPFATSHWMRKQLID